MQQQNRLSLLQHLPFLSCCLCLQDERLIASNKSLYFKSCLDYFFKNVKRIIFLTSYVVKKEKKTRKRKKCIQANRNGKNQNRCHMLWERCWKGLVVLYLRSASHFEHLHGHRYNLTSSRTSDISCKDIDSKDSV